jgi:uncharacterized protein YndB with AHSA1/START domain
MAPAGPELPRPGGVFHYAMRGPSGPDLWGRWVFRQIVPPERLVFVVSFSDEKGGGTVVTIRWSAINATESEHKTFDSSHESMRQGWTGTFDQLAEYLTKA